MSQERLEKIIQFVEFNSIVADIGTDHGLVPISLSKNKISKRIIGVDISEKSLYKLQSKIENNPKFSNIYSRVSDGLKSIKPYEVDTIIISGMGGVLISRILKEGQVVAKSANTLILQANNSVEYLRRFLHENSYYIEDESDIYENNKYYQIIKARSGLEKYYEDYYYEFGKKIIEQGSLNLQKYLNIEISKIDSIINKINKISSDNMEKKINSFNIRKEYLKKVVQEIENFRTNKTF